MAETNYIARHGKGFENIVGKIQIFNPAISSFPIMFSTFSKAKSIISDNLVFHKQVFQFQPV